MPSNATLLHVLDLIGFVGSVLVLGLAVWCLDFAFAKFGRPLFGFPTELVTTERESGPRQYQWQWLGMSKVGTTTTNRAFAAVSNEGLAFEVRSIFGHILMRTVFIPWKRLRLEESQATLGMTTRVDVIDRSDQVAVRVEPGWLDQELRLKIRATCATLGSGQ
ncbi:MAG: hypothetical protein SFV23_12680 [Planctomycetaceae bacterium]|nr:hypothetical protein [Planctomycetaceae bacterium]